MLLALVSQVQLLSKSNIFSILPNQRFDPKCRELELYALGYVFTYINRARSIIIPHWRQASSTQRTCLQSKIFYQRIYRRVFGCQDSCHWEKRDDVSVLSTMIMKCLFHCMWSIVRLHYSTLQLSWKMIIDILSSYALNGNIFMDYCS